VDFDLFLVNVGSLVGLTLGPSRLIAGVRLCLVIPKIFVTTMFVDFDVDALGSVADVVGVDSGFLSSHFSLTGLVYRPTSLVRILLVELSGAIDKGTSSSCL
jgi:hypothetical protein